MILMIWLLIQNIQTRLNMSQRYRRRKQAYDANVMSMQSMLKSCDYATTTTNCLKNELENYCSKVYINRNVASEEMILYRNRH